MRRSKLRRRLLASAVVGLLLGVAAIALPHTASRLYAAQADTCYCSANCFLTDCECIGTASCECSCVFFRAFCGCALK